MEHSLRFSFPTPSSSKNSRQLVRTRSGRMRSFPSTRARVSKEQIAAAAREAIGYARPISLFGDAPLELIVEHDEAAGMCHVCIATLPDREHQRKRDLQNLPESICDALEGIVYDNDNQFDRVTLSRVTR